MTLQTTIPTAITLGKSILYRFPAETGRASNWAGRGGTPQTTFLGQPVTDLDYWQGRYVLCPVTLRREDGQELILPDVVVGLSRAKHIVTTQVVGMSGTVKEYISAGDYDLNIAVGIAAREGDRLSDRYPEEEMRLVRDFLDDDKPLTIQSNFLDLFEINRIVIKSYSLTQQTESNYQDLIISALSDEEYNVYSTDY